VQQEGEKISCSKEEGTAEVQQRGGGSRCSKEEGTAGAAKRRGQQVQQRGGNSRCSKEEGTAGAAKRREQQVQQRGGNSRGRAQWPKNKQSQQHVSGTVGCSSPTTNKVKTHMGVGCVVRRGS